MRIKITLIYHFSKSLCVLMKFSIFPLLCSFFELFLTLLLSFLSVSFRQFCDLYSVLYLFLSFEFTCLSLGFELIFSMNLNCFDFWRRFQFSPVINFLFKFFVVKFSKFQFQILIFSLKFSFSWPHSSFYINSFAFLCLFSPQSAPIFLENSSCSTTNASKIIGLQYLTDIKQKSGKNWYVIRRLRQENSKERCTAFVILDSQLQLERFKL